MTERPPHGLRRALSALAPLGFGMAALCALLAMLSGLGHRWGWWHYGTGFAILRWAAYGGLLAVGLSILGGLGALREASALKAAAAFFGVAIGFALVGVPLGHLRAARRVPPIHDITTDTENPPRFAAVLPLRKGAPNPAGYDGPAVAALQKRGYPDLGPGIYAASPAKVFERAVETARAMGWEIVAAVPAERRIEASDRTFWYGFVDDVVIRLRPADGGTRVDLRSKSRVGRSDLGANARRIRAFLKNLAARVARRG